MDPSVKLCMGCMNELDENGKCHHCNYSDDIPHLQSYLAPKTVLDNRYIIGKMLSYNGEGASYICYDMVAKCKCVCREYMPDTVCERDTKTQSIIVNHDCLAKYKTFMSEFADVNKILSKMRNLQHIATAMDMFCANNTTYVILEYVEGVSLKKFLQSNTGFLSWEQVKKLFVPMFTTLSIIHNAGIIHRGISPENIIVTTDCELKLTGFCISSIRTSNTGLLPEFYSGYTAPEQYSSLEWQGTWTDVYAVAAVLYRILTGCMPLDAYTRTRNDTLVEACRINPRVSPHISRVISNAMAVRGEERIQTITELVAALFEQRKPQMEISKGATQTIPIQHVPKNNAEQIKKNSSPVKKKKKSKSAIIVGWVMLAIVLGFSVFLLIELFSGPSDKDNTSDSSRVVIVDDTDSDEYEYDSAVTTTTNKAVDTSSDDGKNSIMPNIVGAYYDTVVKQLGDEFTIVVEYYYSDTDERNMVYKQSISEGTRYNPEKKEKLTILVCLGPEDVPVPAFTGLSQKQYLVILDDLNIKYTVSEVFSDAVAEGYIVGTDVAVGKTVNVMNGDVLKVEVSKGKNPSATTTTTTKAVTDAPVATTTTTTSAAATTTTTTTTAAETTAETTVEPEQ